jgi:phosphoglycerate dehydrogenase-like enzyme
VNRTVREICSVLATVEYAESHLNRLRDAVSPAPLVRVHPDDAKGIARALKQVDVAILGDDLDERFFRAPKLRWVHCDVSGLELSARPEVFERGLLVTGSAGRSAPALAQHVFFFALALTYDTPGLVRVQKEHAWQGLAGFGSRRCLWGKTLGLVGYGETGRATALLGKAMGMRVLAYTSNARATTEAVDRLLSADRGDTLDELLVESDVVVLCIRLTDETQHLIGERELRLMKRDAYLINVSRGAVVDENALIAALRDGTIAGAGLDVFEQEPLSPDAAIWDAPNTILTHHQTAGLADRTERSLEIICENIGRYRAGEPLRNQLLPRDVYTKVAR